MTITCDRGSALSRSAMSSRHALSTLLRRDRSRGTPPARQEIASAGFAGTRRATSLLHDAVWLWPSETRTVMVAVAGGVAPVKSSVALAPVPDTRPAVVLQS